MGKERSNINLQYDRQAEQAQAQNAWQSDENAIDRQWQEELWKQQFAEQVKQQNEMFEKEGQRWLEQFNVQNEYNLPSNQVARLRAAGINPAAMASQLAGSGVSTASPSASSGASAPSPSGGSSHGVTPIGFTGVSGVSSQAALFSSLAQLNDSLATLAKTGSDVSVSQREVGARVENIIQDTSLKESQTSLNNFNTLLQKQFGGDKMAFEIQKLVSSSYSDYASGHLAEAQSKYNDALTKLTEQETWQKNESFADILANLKALGNFYKAQTHNQYAQAGKATSEARLADAQAEFDEFTNKMRNKFSKSEFDTYLKKLSAEGLLSEKDAEEAKALIETRKFSREGPGRFIDDAMEFIKGKISIFK